jgi:hypothetical protein
MVSQVFKFQLPVVVLLTLSAVALVPAGAASKAASASVRVVGSSGRVYSSFAEFVAAGRRCGTTASPRRLLEVEEEEGRNLRGNSSRQLGKCRPALTSAWSSGRYPAVPSRPVLTVLTALSSIVLNLAAIATDILKRRSQLELLAPTHPPTHPLLLVRCRSALLGVFKFSMIMMA